MWKIIYGVIWILICSPLKGQEKAMLSGSISGQRNASVVAADTSWWAKAIIYEITPYLFVDQATYADIEQKIPELVTLGINTIWLQPVFKNYSGGQGYDIIDYFSLRHDLGNETQLQSLINTAHRNGVKVVFDFVANHTSIHHPYAQDRINNSTASIYADYYQSLNDHAVYSSQYHVTKNNFIYYFWSDLVNLNDKNEAVQQSMINACKYWINKLNIDGYRFDAAWGFNARSPEFGQRLTLQLKMLKPSLLLLAEDKGSTSKPYDIGFNAAYDWTADTSWVSQWSWEYDYTDNNSKTIFNHPAVCQRKLLLQQALFSGQQNGLRLRFLENNDLHRFLANHSVSMTQMAAALLFTLPGIPMIYNGQETGNLEFPYKSGPIFRKDRSISSLNPTWFVYYQRLAGIRHDHPVLSDNYFKQIPVATGIGTIAFHRHNQQEDVVIVTNLDAFDSDAALNMNGICKYP